jgi:hypothetical protein
MSDSQELNWDAALDSIRPSRAFTAFKKASALTRWIILIAIVGIGTAAVIAIALAALFTLVDSSI